MVVLFDFDLLDLGGILHYLLDLGGILHYSLDFGVFSHCLNHDSLD